MRFRPPSVAVSSIAPALPPALAVLALRILKGQKGSGFGVGAGSASRAFPFSCHAVPRMTYRISTTKGGASSPPRAFSIGSSR